MRGPVLEQKSTFRLEQHTDFLLKVQPHIKLKFILDELDLGIGKWPFLYALG